ncbi:hypothetical protein K0T92_07385 [Paenibacillus oenotherae]|uniref:Uncharacterized protein n=1 Tax=Paenibacillus oenotherae TaxID=1435645 RepID=A0ABS7D3W4_9BACL|nr:hypothetical protein [Paenibacillus oenotherae]MBW7474564.1 hypothetical protein [Paenibacillus oenotherae]
MVQLKVSNLTTITDPKLSNYGQMRDLCHDFSYTFSSGRAYGIICECGAGGWGLSYALSGRGVVIDGQVQLDDKPLDQKTLQRVACYVGEEERTRGLLGWYRSISVKKQIIKGLSDSNVSLSYDQIIHNFGLTPERINHKFAGIGNERWNASAAIGMARGSILYCFPWLNSDFITRLRPRIEAIVREAKKQDGIVLIPTCRREGIHDIVDEFVEIKKCL